MVTTDSDIITGLQAGNNMRMVSEKELYNKYKYFINEGCRKFNLSEDDSFSAYSDSVLSVILNIVNESFDGRASIKTYLYQIFSNKCIDLVRKRTTNKHQVHNTMQMPELIYQLPDGARTVVEKLLNNERSKTIHSQLDAIGEKCKALLLMFEDGISDKEVAEKLLYNSVSVVKTTRLRCLEKLREKCRDKNF